MLCLLLSRHLRVFDRGFWVTVPIGGKFRHGLSVMFSGVTRSQLRESSWVLNKMEIW